MPSEARSDLISLALIRGEFEYQTWPYVLGIVVQMELGYGLDVVISSAESRLQNKPNLIAQINTAAKWVRDNITELELVQKPNS